MNTRFMSFISDTNAIYAKKSPILTTPSIKLITREFCIEPLSQLVINVGSIKNRPTENARAIITAKTIITSIAFFPVFP